MDPITSKKILQLTSSGYSRIADQFDKTRQHPWDDFSVFDPFVKEGMSVLDVGCGNGRLFEYLQQRHTIHYVGIDQNQKFIEIAMRNFSGVALQPQFYRANILDSESLRVLGSQQFDIIFCIAVLHHIPTIELQSQALNTLKQYLKPGGFLCMENWNMWQMRKGTKTVWYTFLRRCTDAFHGLYSTDQPPDPLTRCERNQLGWRDLITEWGQGNQTGFLYYYAFRASELQKLLQKSGVDVRDVYFIRRGKRAHWWNGNNIIAVAKHYKI